MRVAILAALLTLSIQANAKEEANSKNIMNKSEAKAKAEKEFVNAKEDTANVTMDLEQLANYKVGYAAIYRPERDTAPGMQFVSEYTIQTSGRLRKWEVYTFHYSEMLLQVWRKHNYLDYHLVGQTSHSSSGGYSTTYDDIEVQAGDVLGWWADGVQPIEYTSGGKLVRRSYANPYGTSRTVSMSGHSGGWARSYSIQATIQVSEVRPGNYDYFPRACVTWRFLDHHIMALYKAHYKTVIQCATLCDARARCKAFEYGVAYGGPGEEHMSPGTCSLLDSDDKRDCDGTYRNLDLYTKKVHQAPTPAPTPAPTSASPHQCLSGGPRQCSHLASFSLLDEVAAFNNDQEARKCMTLGMDAVTTEVSNTCTLSQVQGSLPCGTECWPILEPKILSVQSRCLEKKYFGLERYNKCLLEHSCDKPLAVECRDTNHGRGDRYGDPCYGYSFYPGWCGHYDTGYFHSYSMCCACGGGDWACPDQSAADVMKVQGALDVMEVYLSNISVKLSQTSLESPMPMTHANNETLFLTLAFTGGALTAIMLGVITLRRLKGKRSSAAGHLLA